MGKPTAQVVQTIRQHLTQAFGEDAPTRVADPDGLMDEPAGNPRLVTGAEGTGYAHIYCCGGRAIAAFRLKSAPESRCEALLVLRTADHGHDPHPCLSLVWAGVETNRAIGLGSPLDEEILHTEMST